MLPSLTLPSASGQPLQPQEGVRVFIDGVMHWASSRGPTVDVHIEGNPLARGKCEARPRDGRPKLNESEESKWSPN